MIVKLQEHKVDSKLIRSLQRIARLFDYTQNTYTKAEEMSKQERVGDHYVAVAQSLVICTLYM